MLAWLDKADRSIAGAIGWLADRPLWAAAALIALCLMLYLPGLTTLPPTDRDESRFAQASKQMTETGDVVDIRFQDEARHKKPIGIYWLQALSAATLTKGERNEIWAYRLPSLLAAIAAVLLTWWAARPLIGRRDAWLAAALFAGCFTLALEARIAKADAALLVTIVLAQGALARLTLLRLPRARLAGVAALFWAALGAGILIKGPVAPAISGLTALALAAFDRERAWLRRLHAAWGVPLMLAIALPWFVVIGISTEGAFFRESLGEDFIAKLHSGKETHWAPPGYYFLLFWWTFWPATLIATGGAALWLWRNRRRSRRALLLLAWIVPFWLIIEAVPTKLPHYGLPLYPAVAMAAVWVLKAQTLPGAVPMRSYRQAAVLWLVIALVQAGFLGFVLWFFATASSPLLYGLAVLFAPAVAATAVAAWTARFHVAATLALVSAVLLYCGAYSVVLPGTAPLWPSQRTATALRAFTSCLHGPVALAGYHEPSAVFLHGTDTRLTTAEGAVDALESGAAAYALIADRRLKPAAARFRARGQTPPAPLACIDGFGVNGGRPLTLYLFAARSPAGFGACPTPEAFRCFGRPHQRWQRLLGQKPADRLWKDLTE